MKSKEQEVEQKNVHDKTKQNNPYENIGFRFKQVLQRTTPHHIIEQCQRYHIFSNVEKITVTESGRENKREKNEILNGKSIKLLSSKTK